MAGGRESTLKEGNLKVYSSQPWEQLKVREQERHVPIRTTGRPEKRSS
jgi:hypothetical protein